MANKKPEGWVVGLTLSEFRQAGIWAVERQYQAMLEGKPDAHGYDGDGLEIHCLGILAEVGFAKHLGRAYCFTNGVYRQVEGDVGRFEVRARSNREYALIVRPRDRDGSVFVAAVPFTPRSQSQGPQQPDSVVRWFRYPGWVYGHEAKCFPLADLSGGRPKAHFVPQARLHSMDELPADQTVEIGVQPAGDTVVELRESSTSIDESHTVNGAKPCATCGRPGHRPMDHAGWDPTQEGHG